MKQTLTNINAKLILDAIANAKPVTAIGQLAIENYRNWLSKNAMNATALDNSIRSLQTDCYDAGLEHFITVLKGIMPEQKRLIAVAYETLIQEPKSLFSASDAAFEALANLYDLNASEIISKINEGALDPYATNPTIAKLITYAKNAVTVDQSEMPLLTDGTVSMTITPIMNLQALNDNQMLIAIDGRCFIRNEGGKLTFVNDIRSLESLPADIFALVRMLGMMHISDTEPNMLLLNDDVLSQVQKVIPVKTFGIDLIAGAGDMVVLDGTHMTVDKAKNIINGNESTIIASMFIDTTVKETIDLIGQIMNIFERFRGMLYSNQYVNKFKFGDNVAYIVRNKPSVTLISVIKDTVMGAKTYDSIYGLLGADIIVGNIALADAISKAFSNDLAADAEKLSVRKKLAEQLAKEYEDYKDLLKKIESEENDLASVVDVNKDKVKSLKALKSKVQGAMTNVQGEISKLSL